MFMAIEHKDGKAIQEAVKAAIQRYGATQDELIPILNDVNRAIGYLPGKALDEISLQLKLPKSQLFSVASFYRMLSTKPRGRHVIQFCENAPCHVAGGREVWQALSDELNLKDEETSADGKWSLVTTSCLGICGVGPVMVIDDDIYGNVNPAQVPSILARYH
jgi:NADH:ubiquinone oxidoreductase subunit E